MIDGLGQIFMDGHKRYCLRGESLDQWKRKKVRWRIDNQHTGFTGPQGLFAYE